MGLRLAMQRSAPLIYLFGVVEGEYMPPPLGVVAGEFDAGVAAPAPSTAYDILRLFHATPFSTCSGSVVKRG